MKCTPNANDSTYILYGFLIKTRTIQGLIYDYANVKKKKKFLLVKTIFEVYQTQMQRDNKMPSGIKALEKTCFYMRVS